MGWHFRCRKASKCRRVCAIFLLNCSAILAAHLRLHGTLDRWARQGVLLLNAVFTVERGLPGSHARKGWETLTSMLLGALAADQRPKVFMLWGALAQAWRASLTEPHLDTAGESSIAAVGAPSADSVCGVRTLLASEHLFAAARPRTNRLVLTGAEPRRARSTAASRGAVCCAVARAFRINLEHEL